MMKSGGLIFTPLALVYSFPSCIRQWALLICMLGAGWHTLPGKIIYINSNGNARVHDGTSWATAFADLKTGLVIAEDGDEIWVAKGIYTPTLGVQRAATFLCLKELTILGGFAGNEQNPEERDFRKHKTLLSGDLNRDDRQFDNRSENSFHIVSLHGDANVVLDGFVIEGGNANGTQEEEEGMGGAILMRGKSRLVLRNCILARNHARLGGGIYAGANCQLTIHTSTIKGNSATYGGAVYNVSQQPCLIQKSVFSGNTGIAVVNKIPFPARQRLYNCSFAGNSGGAVYFSDECQATLDHTVIWANEVSTSLPPIKGAIRHCLIESQHSPQPGTDYSQVFVEPPNPKAAPSLAGNLVLSQAFPHQEMGAFAKLQSEPLPLHAETSKPVEARPQPEEVTTTETPVVQAVEEKSVPPPAKVPERALPFQLYAYPNPFTSHVNLHFNTDLTDEAQVALENDKGQQFLSQKVDLNQKNFKLEIKEGLPAGLYRLVFTYQDQTYIQVLNKW